MGRKLKVLVYDGNGLHGVITAETNNGLDLSRLVTFSGETLKCVTSKKSFIENFTKFGTEITENEILTKDNILEIKEDVKGVLGGDIVLLLNASAEKLTLCGLHHNQVTLNPSAKIYIDTESFIFIEE